MSPTSTCPAERYLRVLAERAPRGTLLEVRYCSVQAPEQFGRFFIDIGRLQRRIHSEAARITTLGQRTDVYVGCAPRLRYSGRREDIAPAALLWADCDTPAAIRALKTFTPTPTMTVLSGSTSEDEQGRHEHTHAYWALTHPLTPTAIEAANRRLAQALGADPTCTDAMRILRVPETFNFKHRPPTPTSLAGLNHTRHRPQDLLPLLPELGPLPPPAPLRVTRRDPDPARGQDPLQTIAPRHYIRTLTGQTPGPNNKIHCPFHNDRTPSLHAYPTPEQGWSCFACKTTTGRRLGGDIYTLASLLWNIPNRGQSFHELRDRLDELFGVERSRGR